MGSPAMAEPGIVMPVTTRSEGGGSAMSKGVSVDVALLPSLLPSKTLPRGEKALGGSVKTKVYHGPVKPRGALSEMLFV